MSKFATSKIKMTNLDNFEDFFETSVKWYIFFDNSITSLMYRLTLLIKF